MLLTFAILRNYADVCDLRDTVREKEGRRAEGSFTDYDNNGCMTNEEEGRERYRVSFNSVWAFSAQVKSIPPFPTILFAFWQYIILKIPFNSGKVLEMVVKL